MKKINLLYVIAFMLAASGCTVTGQIAPEQLKQASVQNAQLGLGYMKQGRYEVALRKLKKAIVQNPENVDAQHYIAELYRRLDRPVKAEEHFQVALKLLPDDSLSSHVSTVRNNYAVFLCEQKKYSEAKSYFEKILNDPLYKQKDQLYENMGLCELNKGATHQAENYLYKAIRKNPKLPKSLLAIAQISFDKSLYTQANVYLNKYLAITKHNSQSLWLALLLERNKGKNADKGRIANYSIRLKGKYPDSKETMLLRQLELKGNM